MSPHRYTLSIAAALALLLFTATLHAQTALAQDGSYGGCNTDAGPLRCGFGLLLTQCKGCMTCKSGYYMEQTYDDPTSTFTSWCVQDTTSTEGCASITNTPIPTGGSIIYDAPNPYDMHCLSCKSGYTLVKHTAQDFAVGLVTYGVCVKDSTSVAPVPNTSRGQSTTVPAVLLLLAALATALYTAL